MQIIRADEWVPESPMPWPASLRLPDGCVGMVLVYDDEEAARRAHPGASLMAVRMRRDAAEEEE
jgi:hypothetical protein